MKTKQETLDSRHSPSRDICEMPAIIQGGMGAGVSDWRLARAVAQAGHVGVVSSTALDMLLVRRLQDGDPGGAMRAGLAAFPDAAVAERILDRWFLPEGRAEGARYASKSLVGDSPSRETLELLVAANFIEVFLAKQGHRGWVGVNLLHKIQAPLLASLWGAILADVDAVFIGAGIPAQVPGILAGLARSEAVSLDLEVTGATRPHRIHFDPGEFLGGSRPQKRRPLFFPIISSRVLASRLVRGSGAVDGWIVEGFQAGGHNAPPRGRSRATRRGDSEGAPGLEYGDRDLVDPQSMVEFGRPFWLAGSYGHAGGLAEALQHGAQGIQVGTLFAFCEESGLREDLKARVVRLCRENPPRPVTDPRASPTGFPFKVLPLHGTLSDETLYGQRRRRCDMGYLREAYEREDGSIGWRCAAESPAAFVAKGGELEATVGRKCLCNALAANIGLAQRRGAGEELPLITSGEMLEPIQALLRGGKSSYSAAEVLQMLSAG